MPLYFYTSFVLILIVATLLFGIYFLRWLSTTGKLILAQVALGLATEVTGSVMAYKNTPNTPVFNIYMVVEFILLGSAAIVALKDTTIRRLLIAAMALATVFYTYSIINSGLHVFANKAYVIFAFLVVIMYFLVLVKTSTAKGEKIVNPLSSICIAHIIYFGACIPLFSLLHYLNQNHPILLKSLFDINFFLVVIRYGLVALAFYLFSGRKFTFKKATVYDR